MKRLAFAVALLVVLGVGALWTLDRLVGPDPKPMDATLLEPRLQGLAVIDGPREACPQGAEPIGDCDAVARVVAPGDESALDFLAANAAAAGFVEDASAPDVWLYEARRSDLCLAVAESSHVERVPGELRVYLSWCDGA